VARDRPQPALVELADRPLQEPAGRGGKRLAVEHDVADRNRRGPLPGNHGERPEVGHDLCVAEIHLGAEPGPVDHVAGMIDAERRDAEVDPVLDALLDERDRHDLVPGDPEEIGEVHADALDPRLAGARDPLLGGDLLFDGHG
jgi:hypothetical protein